MVSGQGVEGAVIINPERCGSQMDPYSLARKADSEQEGLILGIGRRRVGKLLERFEEVSSQMTLEVIVSAGMKRRRPEGPRAAVNLTFRRCK